MNSGTTINITTDTAWDGPALATSGFTETPGAASERFWLMWAGNDAGHHINIAEYQPGSAPSG